MARFQPTCPDLWCYSKGADRLRLEGPSRTVAIMCPGRYLGSLRHDGMPIPSDNRVIDLHHRSWRTQRDPERRSFLSRNRHPLASVRASRGLHLDSATAAARPKDRPDDSCGLGKLLGALEAVVGRVGVRTRTLFSVGRADSRRRKPRHRLPPAGSRLYNLSDTPMTPAGEIRAFGRIADAWAYGSRRHRRAVVGLFVGWLVVPLVFALVAALIYILVQHL